MIEELARDMDPTSVWGDCILFSKGLKRRGTCDRPSSGTASHCGECTARLPWGNFSMNSSNENLLIFNIVIVVLDRRPDETACGSNHRCST